MEISQYKLTDALAKAMQIVTARGTLPILSSVKLTFENGVFFVDATNLEQFISICLVDVESSEDESFSVVIDAKRLFSTISRLNGNITLIVKENVLTVSCGRFKAQFSTINAEEFPVISNNDSIGNADETFRIDKHLFCNRIRNVAFASSKDETRQSLTGINVDLTKGKLTMVATDGHKLSESSVSTDVIENVNFTVNAVATQSLERIMHDETDFNVCLGSKYVHFEGENTTYSVKLIDSPYPDYKKVVPTTNSKSAIIDRQGLVDSIRRVLGLTNEQTNLIKFKFSDKELKISVQNMDNGSLTDDVLEIEYVADEDLLIGFNAMYLLDILKLINTENVEFSMNSKISAVLLLPYGEEKTEDLFLIMPLRIMEE